MEKSQMLVVDSSALIAAVFPKGQTVQAPINIPVSQIIVTLPDGTPVFVAGQYGPEKGFLISRLGDKDFEYALELFQVDVKKVEIVVPDLKTRT